jgi:hypothetical protein
LAQLRNLRTLIPQEFAIADGAQEFADLQSADFKHKLARPPMQNDKTKEKFKINTRTLNVSTQQLTLRNTCYAINEAVRLAY